jgi:hypothetical protein
MFVKKAWITPWPNSAELVTLSIESADTEPADQRLSIYDRVFPTTPTPAHPQRHVLSIGLLEPEDLKMIRDALSAYLEAFHS